VRGQMVQKGHERGGNVKWVLDRTGERGRGDVITPARGRDFERLFRFTPDEGKKILRGRVLKGTRRHQLLKNAGPVEEKGRDVNHSNQGHPERHRGDTCD